MRHPFQVSIVSPQNHASTGTFTVGEIIIARRSTLEKAQEHRAALIDTIGRFNRNGIPAVRVTDLRTGAVIDANGQRVSAPAPAPDYDDED